LKQIWAFALAISLLCGVTVTLGAGGAEIKNRIVGAVLWGAATGALSTIISAGIYSGSPIGISGIIVNSMWRIFIFTIFSVVGLLITEIYLPEPKIREQKTEDRRQMADSKIQKAD
jgi:hypothetical protein